MIGDKAMEKITMFIHNTKEDAYMLFNLYIEGYIQGCQRASDVSFVGLLKIYKWIRHINLKK